MTFFPLSLKALATTCDRGACRGCGRPDTPEVDRQCCAGLRMAVPQDRFRDHDLRVAGPAAGSACVGDPGSIDTLWPDSIGANTHASGIDPGTSFAGL